MYIATQGPKKNTTVDFWTMILEKNVSIVTCLANTVEAGRVSQYQTISCHYLAII